MAWGLDYFPGDEPEFECRVCQAPITEDKYYCCNKCFYADQL